MTREPDKWFALAEETHSRDPREAPFGYLSKESFPLSSVCAFHWFATVEEMIHHLLEVEPRLCSEPPYEGIEEYQQAARPVLGLLMLDGPTEHLRRVFEAAHDGGFEIVWWGHYHDLRDGRTDYGCDLRDSFVRRANRTERSPRLDEDEFIDFLYMSGA